MRLVRTSFSWTLFISAFILTGVEAGRADSVTYVPEIRTNNGAQELWIVPSPGSGALDAIKFGTIDTVPSGTIYYHWSGPKGAGHLAKLGREDSRELKLLLKGEGNAGGGFYVSTDIMDSSDYGPKLTVFKTKKPIQLLSIEHSQGNGALISLESKIQDWDAFNLKLAALKVDGIANYENEHPTWINVISTRPINNAHAATWDDVEKSGYFEKQGFDDASIQKLLTFNTLVPVQDSPWLEAHFPVFHQLLNGKVDPSAMSSNASDLIKDWLQNSSTASDLSLMTQSLRNYFNPQIAGDFKSEWDEARKDLGSKKPWQTDLGDTMEGLIKSSRQLRMPVSSWIPGVEEPKPLFANYSYTSPSLTPSFDYEERVAKSATAKKLNEHFSYLNFSDFLHAIATDAPIEKLYDEAGKSPYASRYQNAIAASKKSGADPISVLQKLSGNPKAGYRSEQASSDGDILLNGKKYFQVNGRQKIALEQNPYVHSEFLTIPDPKDATKTIQISRYDYPNAADFEIFKDWLSAPLLDELSKAKASGALNHPENPQISSFTQKMLGEITQKLMTDQSTNELKRYTLFLSLHPFTEMNAEAAPIITRTAPQAPTKKMFYSGLRTVPGRPDENLLYPMEDFFALAYHNVDNSLAIQEAFIREEALHPGAPKYFDVPEIWQVGRKMRDTGSDTAKFVAESKAIFAAIESCILTTLTQSLKTP